jgi:site-specific DNA-methyltransferase (cytosine-N4-specific)
MPIEMPLSCIAAGCQPGGTVLDMFAGTAVTGLAARALGRSFIGIEETPALCDGAARALQQDTDPGEAP